MASRPIASRFFRNAGFVVAGRAWYVLAWFLLTPYVLEQLGPERFGVWSLLFLLSGYLATFDLGLGASIVKFTAEHGSRQEWGVLRRVLSEILRVYLLLGLLWVVLVFLLHPLILDWMKIPDLYRAEVRIVLLASAVIFAIANLANTGPGVLNGLQRMDLTNGLMVSASIPQFLVLILGVHLGYGLYAVACSTAVQWLCVGLGAWLLLRKTAPGVHWPSFIHEKSGVPWFRFSAVMQINNIIALTHHQIDKVLLTTWVGLRSVAEFELSFRVANGIQSIPVLALSPLLPAFAELDAEGDSARFRRLWHRGTRLLTSAALGLAACALPVSPFLIRAWVGPEYPLAETLTPWLIAGFAFSLCTGVATSAARGAGKPGLEVAPALTALAVHVVISAVLIRNHGPGGIGPAFLAGSVVWAILYLTVFARWARVGVGLLFASVFIRPGLAVLPALAAGHGVIRILPPSLLDGRWGLLAGAAVAMVAAGVGFAAIWWLLGLAPPIGRLEVAGTRGAEAG